MVLLVCVFGLGFIGGFIMWVVVVVGCEVFGYNWLVEGVYGVCFDGFDVIIDFN